MAHVNELQDDAELMGLLADPAVPAAAKRKLVELATQLHMLGQVIAFVDRANTSGGLEKALGIARVEPKGCAAEARWL